MRFRKNPLRLEGFFNLRSCNSSKNGINKLLFSYKLSEAEMFIDEHIKCLILKINIFVRKPLF
jgi:hypothetical protein